MLGAAAAPRNSLAGEHWGAIPALPRAVPALGGFLQGPDKQCLNK